LLLLLHSGYIIANTSPTPPVPAKPDPSAHKKNQLCKTNPISPDFASKTAIWKKNKPNSNPILKCRL